MLRAPTQVLWWAAACLLLVGCIDDKIAGGRADGPKLYEEACARCHGPGGVPTQGMQSRTGVKPLNTSRVGEMTDAQIFDQIRNGSKNRLMPAFQGAMTEEQMKALVGHIRTLQATSAD